MLELKNISYKVEGAEILKDVSLKLPDGQLTVFTGPNGGGKTTLAKVIMGLVEPSSGSIIWQGEDISSKSVTERAKLGISYGFQQPPRFKGLKVRDLLEIASGKKSLRKSEACAYLTEVGLCANDYIDREVDASLSGGELKRIEIASILARKTELLIFDEPEAGIDLWSFARLAEAFSKIHDRRESSMIIISHQERLIRLADEIVVISGGQITNRGATEKVLPQIMADTLSCCPMLEGRAQ
ncbi:MAG: ATP-binding cassette domain-containing protein [Oscillospiraceae bacterium]|nr:ATP-binding cassette domain-containing protein [Oscillospiraceae bacterium]